VIGLTLPVQAQAPLHQCIDEALAAGNPDFAKQAAPLASDTEFLRRIYLDLTGTIPSAAEARAFLTDPSADKRQRLLDRLLASPEYARHMQNVFDVMLIERRPARDRQGVPQAQWQEYLRASFAQNKPWDQLVREVITADGFDEPSRPAARFNLARQGEPQTLALDISRLFLGMNFQCAQCHDHPMVTSYKQDLFYGVMAFLNRSYLFADPKVVAEKRVAYIAEKAEGEVTFQSVFDPNKVTRQTGPRLPGGMPVREPQFEKGQEYETVAATVEVKGATHKPPVPKFSRRAQLALQLTTLENAQFRRTSANRFWALMMGRGLVHPIDLDHDENPPSHPDLLTLLADEFAALKFDVKAFLRELALTRTYQRSSDPPGGVKEVPPASFAAAPVKPMSPEQLAWSLMRATGLIDAERQAQGKNLDEKTLESSLAGNVAAIVAVFGTQPGQPESFQATLDQPLFLANGALLRDWIAPRPGNLADRLAQLQQADEVAEELFLSVLTRQPTGEERQEVHDYLKARPTERSAALQDLIWALLASAEFRFYH
jgi:hypothetical protein